MYSLEDVRTERLMSGGGGHMSVGNGTGMKPCRHQTCNMRHIHHQHRSHLVSHLTELLKVNDAGIGRSEVPVVSGGTDNHLMLVDLRNLNITGKEAEKLLDQANITCNKNTIPNDPIRGPP